MDLTCPRCGYDSETYRGLAIHFGKSHDGGNLLVELVGGNTLQEMYVDMSQREMADKFGVTVKMITKALEYLGADLRDRSEAAKHHIKIHGKRDHHFDSRPPYLTHHSQGYEEIRHAQKRIYVHRLAAVAWFGFDAVSGHHVHHDNNIPWDNREDNLEVLSESEHRSHHAKEMWDKGYGIANRHGD